jgi:hypothetical protein
MSDGPTTSELGIVPNIDAPINIASDVRQRLNHEGLGRVWEPLKVVNAGRIALNKMPEGQTGVVLGSGPNTESWRQKGWQTLDIDAAAKADFTADANKLDEVLPPGSQNYILAECIRFDETAERGVASDVLLSQANRALAVGGKLVIETAHFENHPTSKLPDRKEYAKRMTAYGFNTVVELNDYISFGPDGEKQVQKVVYYGEKKDEAFDESRLRLSTQGVRYDRVTGLPLTQ